MNNPRAACFPKGSTGGAQFRAWGSFFSVSFRACTEHNPYPAAGNRRFQHFSASGFVHVALCRFNALKFMSYPKKFSENGLIIVWLWSILNLETGCNAPF
jgi:hypothetical protein